MFDRAALIIRGMNKVPSKLWRAPWTFDNPGPGDDFIMISCHRTTDPTSQCLVTIKESIEDFPSKRLIGQLALVYG